MNKAVFFTGHRPDKLGGYDAHAQHGRIRDFIQAIVEDWYTAGYNVWISGMALGTDTIAAQAVLQAKVRHPGIMLVAAVPFPSQPKAWTRHWSRVVTYREVLGQCTAIYTVSQDPYTRDKMMLRNRFMVEFPDVPYFHLDGTDVLPCETTCGIAVYNGSGGGTGNAVNHAKSVGKTVLGIHPDTLATTWL